jgi:hypothetical protein
LGDLRLGTDWYQINLSGTNAPRDSPYRFSIGHRRTTPRDETMLRWSPDRQEVVSVTGTTVGTNIKGLIDRRIREKHQREYWRLSANIEVRIRILEWIGRLE